MGAGRRAELLGFGFFFFGRGLPVDFFRSPVFLFFCNFSLWRRQKKSTAPQHLWQIKSHLLSKFCPLPFCGVTLHLVSCFFWISSQMSEFSQKTYPSPFRYASRQRAGEGWVPGRCGDCSGKVPLHEGSGQSQEKRQRLCLLHPRHAEKEGLNRVAVWGTLLMYVNSSLNSDSLQVGSSSGWA